jgi:hypothetical protein
MPAELKPYTTDLEAAEHIPVRKPSSQPLHTLIESAFAWAEDDRRAVTMEWRLIRRKRWPFLLLPVKMETEVALRLYSPQRRRARLARALFPWMLNTPAAVMFERVRFLADPNGDFIRFAAEQAGVKMTQFTAPAVKFGGTEEKSRLVLMVCDETQRPVSVIKAGLDRAGRAATDREAALLEQLPAGKLGCIRLTGRFSSGSLSAFSTAYYPGDSPADDAGLEQLFSAWLNPEAPAPVESLAVWQELEARAGAADPEGWRLVRSRLAGRRVRTTLYHGDFAPWNIRAINTTNLQAFDWEQGDLRGFPGWDWFHFIVQTAILARRLPVERVAAEVEQTLHSERFMKYAAEAGIRDVVKPLMLASLLHQRWVVRPLEGGRTTYELFKLLAVRWQMNLKAQLNGDYALPAEENPGTGWRAEAGRQLTFAVSRLRNLFWEPSLNSQIRPTMAAQWRGRRGMILAAGGLLGGMMYIHRYTNPHLAHFPFYLTPCLLVTWQAGRRWGALFATAAAVAGPLIKRMNDTDFQPPYVVVWDTCMGLFMLQWCVLLFDRMLQQKNPAAIGETANVHSRHFADNWAVVLASGAWLAAVATLQFYSSPHLGFMPLYLLPCLALTLTVGRSWGLVAAVFAAVVGPYVQRFGDADYLPVHVEVWNTLIRLLSLQVTILLVDRLHRDNIVFFPNAPRPRSKPSGAPVPAAGA